MPTANLIKCRYCEWTTPRFRGKQTGHYALRRHVITDHYDEFCTANGLESDDEGDYSPSVEDLLNDYEAERFTEGV